jgi:hypothetical protein
MLSDSNHISSFYFLSLSLYLPYFSSKHPQYIRVINDTKRLIDSTYFLLCLDDRLHKEDGGGLKLWQERFTVLHKEVMHLSLASESLLEILNAHIRE